MKIKMKNSIPCPGCQEEYCCGYIHCDSPAKGNKVREYVYEDGSRGIIMDAGFKTRTPAELKEVENNARQIAMNIMLESLRSGEVW